MPLNLVLRQGKGLVQDVHTYIIQYIFIFKKIHILYFWKGHCGDLIGAFALALIADNENVYRPKSRTEGVKSVP